MERPDAEGDARTVLVVDDEEAVREYMTLALEGAGYRVHGVDTGDKALQAVADPATSFDLVVLDLTLPGMSGEEVYRTLRAQQNDFPVLLMSGRFPDWTPTGAHDTFLLKPFRLQELTGVVSTLLAARGKPTV